MAFIHHFSTTELRFSTTPISDITHKFMLDEYSLDLSTLKIIRLFSKRQCSIDLMIPTTAFHYFDKNFIQRYIYSYIYKILFNYLISGFRLNIYIFLNQRNICKINHKQLVESILLLNAIL